MRYGSPKNSWNNRSDEYSRLRIFHIITIVLFIPGVSKKRSDSVVHFFKYINYIIRFSDSN